MVDNFKLYLDVDIDIEKAKSEEKGYSSDDSRYDNMIFSGVASDNSKDSEGEYLDPNGFIYDRFLKSGLINLDHLPTRSPINKSRFWIGEPLEAYVKEGKFFVKGKLWKKSPEARAFWDKAIEMKESGSSRKPGMSVEGKALERDKQNPNKVLKALITNVALTMTPVNTKTYVDIVKSGYSSDTILLERRFKDQILRIDKSFNISLLDPKEGQKNLIKSLCDQYREGAISEKVLIESLKKIKERF